MGGGETAIPTAEPISLRLRPPNHRLTPVTHRSHFSRSCGSCGEGSLSQRVTLWASGSLEGARPCGGWMQQRRAWAKGGTESTKNAGPLGSPLQDVPSPMSSHQPGNKWGGGTLAFPISLPWRGSLSIQAQSPALAEAPTRWATRGLGVGRADQPQEGARRQASYTRSRSRVCGL